MTWVDSALAAVIILFIIVMVWSRIQQQRMFDTMKEIKDIVLMIGGKVTDGK